MKILCIGDIVGRPGRNAVARLVPELTKEYDLQLIVANAENAAGGTGLTIRTAQELFDAGCGILTTGDHVWDKPEIEDIFRDHRPVVRPANFPDDTPGTGWCVVKAHNGVPVGIVNLLGRVFMRYAVDCPFRTAQKLVRTLKEKTAVIIIDMHAEATSEKVAFGRYIDGSVSAVIGSHTHIQTADEKILPAGTAYITDAGMTGPYDSVIGQDKDRVITRFVKSMPLKFNVATNDVQLHGVVVDIDEATGMARSIIRIQRKLE